MLCARICTWPSLALVCTYLARTIVAMKLWQCEKKDLELVCLPPSFADILATRLFKQRVLIFHKLYLPNHVLSIDGVHTQTPVCTVYYGKF